MPSRQDQLHAYQFSLQRVVAALVTHDPDAARSTSHLGGGRALASLLVAALLLGGTAAYAAVAGGNTVDLRDETAIYVERDTGAKYVYSRADDQLHPVLNYSSARLIVNSPQARSVAVSQSALTSGTVALGRPLGIPGAPDSLPGRGRLTTATWTLCSQNGTGDAAGQQPTSTLSIGAGATGGHPLTVSRSAGNPEALLVADPDRRVHLVYGNRRFRLPNPRSVQVAFGWSNRRPVAVDAAWLNTLPAGPDVEPLPIRGLGERSAVPGARIGQLFTAPGASGGTLQWAVAVADGILYISEVQAKVLQADPATGAGEPQRLDQAALSGLPPSDRGLPGGPDADLLPAEVPALLDVSRAVCLTVPGATEQVSSVLVDPVVAPVGREVAGAAGARRRTLADRVHVAPGRAVLVEAAASPTAPAGTGAVSVLTDTGLRYPVAQPAVLESLGYGGIRPHRLPAGLVALLPAGPALDPERARTTPTENR